MITDGCKCLALLGLALTAACSDDRPEAVTDTDDPGFTTDVIGIEDAFLTPKYWIERAADGAAELLSGPGIARLNEQSFATSDTMVYLGDYPDELGAEHLLSLLQKISRRAKGDRFYASGALVSDADYTRYEASLNRDDIRDTNPVRFGMAVTRADMRTYPTDDRIFKTAAHSDLDRFQENALFPADVVAILHASTDGEWLLVQSYNYLAWVQSTAIAIGSREIVFAYKDRPEFVVITGNKVITTYNPHVPEISELQLDMGIRLPLARPADVSNNLHGQNPYASYTVELPVRNAAGELRLELALIARSADVSVGYLPYTRDNLISQSFKFLGERYGWGHSYNARDCSGFVAEIYKSFGVYLPRNSGDQSNSAIGRNSRFDGDEQTSRKLEELRSLDIGSLIFIPGHVMMYIGEVDGEPYVIHDVAGLNYTSASGEFYSGVLSGVSVTPLLPLGFSADKSYVDSIKNIKEIK